MKAHEADKLWQRIDQAASLAILVIAFGCLTVGLARQDDDRAFSAMLMLVGILCLAYTIWRVIHPPKH